MQNYKIKLKKCNNFVIVLLICGKNVVKLKTKDLK